MQGNLKKTNAAASYRRSGSASPRTFQFEFQSVMCGARPLRPAIYGFYMLADSPRLLLAYIWILFSGFYLVAKCTCAEVWVYLNFCWEKEVDLFYFEQFWFYVNILTCHLKTYFLITLLYYKIAIGRFHNRDTYMEQTWWNITLYLLLTFLFTWIFQFRQLYHVYSLQSWSLIYSLRVYMFPLEFILSCRQTSVFYYWIAVVHNKKQ